MASERLGGLATPDIPQFRGRITSARDEDILVGAEGQTILFEMSNFVKEGKALSGVHTS
jgi:hypothetical protein